MKFEQVEKKIQNPPAAHNVARLLDPDSEIKTTLNIARFAVSIPSFNYLVADAMIKDRVALKLELETAVAATRTKGAPSGRNQNESLVRAFFAYDELRGYSNARVVDPYKGSFRISRSITVPTPPTFVILENGKQVPVVICGWKNFSLKREQIRVWVSMLDSGLFSFADYLDAPWEIALFPEQDTSDGCTRFPKIIRPGDYALMRPSDLSELSAMYARAQKAAMPIAREMWEKRERVRKEKEAPFVDVPLPLDHPASRDLFADWSKGQPED
jgi:hypothetical protein